MFLRYRVGIGASIIAISLASFSAQFVAAASSNIVPSLDAARTAGVAPLSVFFDASGTTDVGITSLPFHQLDYSWNFGDPNAGTWAQGSNPNVNKKNIAYGPEVAHVFDTPGTYTVTLSVTDGSATKTKTVSITVQDPDTVFSGANTICVAANSTPTAGSGGCPAGAAVHQDSDFGHAVNTYATAGKRLLFKRGDSFVSKTQGILNAAGPGIIGAYGTGAKPYITTTLTGAFVYELFLKSNVQDWRIMDLEMDGKLDGTIGGVQFAGGSYKQVLLERLFVHDIGGGITLSISPNSPSVPDQISMVDSTIQHIVATKGGPVEGSFWAATRLSLMGNAISDTLTGVSEHILRIQYTDRAFLSNNTLSKVNPAKEMIALRQICASSCTGSQDFSKLGLTGKAAATKRVVVSDNHLLVNSYIGVQEDFSGAGGATAGYAYDTLLERNWYEMQPGAGGAITMRVDGLTIRNEVIDMSLSKGKTAISLRGLNYFNNAFQANNVFVYQNTVVNLAGDGTGITMLNSTAANAVSNVFIQNNLGYAPTSGRETNYVVPNLPSTSVTGSFVVDHNSTGSGGAGATTNQMQLNDPKFASAKPTTAGGFKISSGSYAVGAGTSVLGAYRDFFGNFRSSSNDLGAFALNSSSAAPAPSTPPVTTTPPPKNPPPTTTPPVKNPGTATTTTQTPPVTPTATSTPPVVAPETPASTGGYGIAYFIGALMLLIGGLILIVRR